MRKLLQRLWDIAADFANFMGGLGMRLVWLPKLHFSPGAEQVRTDPGPCAVRAESQLVDGCPDAVPAVPPQTHFRRGGG